MRNAIVAALALSLLTAAPAMASHHVRKTSTVTQTAVPKSDDTPDGGIEAYSDTTTEAWVDSMNALAGKKASPVVTARYDESDFMHDMGSFVRGMNRFSGAIALCVIVSVLLFFLLPIIALVLLLRYLTRRNSDRKEVINKAIAAGVDVPEDMKPIDKQSGDYAWRSGVRNLSIGVGLVLMSICFGSGFLAGVGMLVACMGGGQMFIGRSARKREERMAQYSAMRGSRRQPRGQMTEPFGPESACREPENAPDGPGDNPAMQ